MKDIKTNLTKEEREEQKKLKEELKKIIKNDYIKDIAYILKYKNDYYIFNKTNIKTCFCFGYGQNGISNENDEKNAVSDCYFIKSNEAYFLNENLKELREELKKLKRFKNEIKKDGEDAKIKEDFRSYVFKIHDGKWMKNSKNCAANIKYIEYNQYILNQRTVLNDLKTNIDINLINEIIKIKYLLFGMFKKRLYTYFKKYGLSKLNTWTYLID